MGQSILIPAAVIGGGGFRPYVIRITFDSIFTSGEPFTVSGLGFSYSGIAPPNLVYDVDVPNGGVSYIVRCRKIEAIVDVEMQYGIYTVTIAPTNLHAMTWEQIKTISDDIEGGANPSEYGLSIGDEIDTQLSTNEVLTLQIYDFLHDDKADGSGKAGMTFGMKHLMTSTRRMNGTNTSVGGFTASEMYAWLQGSLLNSLSTDLQAVIKSINKKTSAGNLSTTINIDTMKIFMLSEFEYSGMLRYTVAGEGTQYPVFTDNASRIKNLSNGSGSPERWWGRSPRIDDVGAFCCGLVSGSLGVGYSGTQYGVCFGFCV